MESVYGICCKHLLKIVDNRLDSGNATSASDKRVEGTTREQRPRIPKLRMNPPASPDALQRSRMYIQESSETMRRPGSEQALERSMFI